MCGHNYRAETACLQLLLHEIMPKVVKNSVKSTRNKSITPYTNPIIKLKRLKSIENIMSNTNDISFSDEERLLADDNPKTIKTHTSKSMSAETVKQAENADILSMLRVMREEQLTKNDLKLLTESIDNKFDLVNSRIDLQANKIDEFDARLTKFENTTMSSNYNGELNKQKAIRNNISIMGIPLTSNENTMHIAINVFKFLGLDIDSKIVSAYRTTGKNTSKNLIIAKLIDYDTKLMVLNHRAKKTIKLKDVADCATNTGETTIFINNHVTPYFGKLLFLGRQAVKNKQIFSCWISSNGCQLKLSESGEQHNYSSEEDLQRLITGNGNPTGANKRHKPDHAGISPKALQHVKKSK